MLSLDKQDSAHAKQGGDHGGGMEAEEGNEEDRGQRENISMASQLWYFFEQSLRPWSLGAHPVSVVVSDDESITKALLLQRLYFTL